MHYTDKVMRNEGLTLYQNDYYKIMQNYTMNR